MKKLLQIPKLIFGFLLVVLFGCTTLQAQSVLVTSPNGGESWSGGSTHAITWTYSNVDNISIEFSKDNGLTWTTLTSSIPASTLSYSWTVPAVGSNLCKVRIKSLTQNSQDDSNTTFTIPEPTVALAYPIGGETFGVGTGQYIEWSTTGVTTVMVQYSTNNAATWNDIGTFPAGNNYCNWEAPTTANTQTKIRVYNVESVINQATSPAPFSITAMPTSAPEKYYGGSNDGYKMASSFLDSLSVVTPNGGESYYPNNAVNITWSFRNIDAVKIEYSTNNGSSWNVIAASVVADLQTYSWTIPNSPTSQCLIKVSDLGSSLSDISNATFAINSASVTLTYPNGGESFGEGTGQYIEWTSSSVATVLLEYSADNGTTWNSIGTSTATNNYANWVPPAGANSQCLIRVSDSSTPSVSDTSNATFAISTLPVADVAKYFGGANDGYSMVNNIQPNITITSPNGGESWAAYSTRTITWSYTNVDNVSIEFSIDNGTSWTTLVASIPASQLSYSWTVPGTPSNYCSFRIKDIASSVSDINDAVFVIPNDLWVQIKYPNGGETFGVGTGQYIEWDYNNIQTIKLEYSTDNGANWLVIGTVNAADKYANWISPSYISNQILLRAYDVNNALFNDVSDLVFSTYALPTTASEKYFGGSNDGYSMFSVIVVPCINNPTIDLGSDVTACGTSTTLTAPTGYDSYVWSNDATTNTTTVSANGTYSCTVTQGGCSATDSIDVTLIVATISASDSVICAGETVTLSVTQGGSSNTACAALPTSLQTGLVGYWPFCGNANDASGNGNNGTVNGATLSTDRFGSVNSAYSFDGSSNLIDLGNSASYNLQSQISISVWIYIIGGTQNPRILQFGNNNFDEFGIETQGTSDTSRVVNGYFGGFPSNASLTAMSWHHVAYVANRLIGTSSIYFDGQIVGQNMSAPGATINYNACNFIIGNKPCNNSDYWGGKIDDVGLYNRNLSATEIQQIYTLGQTSYSWSNGSTTPTINVSPTSTTTYTCTTTTNGVSCSSNYTITVNNSSASTNIVTAFDSFTWLDGNTYTASNNTATYTTTNAAGCDSVISLNLTITPSSPTLALQVFLDGYYINGSNPAAMTAARYNNLVASGSATPGAATDVDVITVELRSPSNLDVVAYSVSPILQTNGSAQCVFPAGALGGSYYLVVKHRATNPLWSANPVTLSSSSAFSFANNSSNSYSDGSTTPIHTLVPSLFGIWLGELNDDGYLDGLDYPWFENETYSSVYGGLYLLDGDFNGDAYVDASDYAVFDYNSTIGSYEQRPY